MNQIFWSLISAGNLSRRRQACRDLFLEDVFRCVAQDFTASSRDKNISQLKKDKPAFCRERYAAFMGLLAQKSIQPYDTVNSHNLYSVLKAVDDVARMNTSTKYHHSNIVSSLGQRRLTKGYLGRDSPTELLQIIDQHVGQIKGICLGCWDRGVSGDEVRKSLEKYRQCQHGGRQCCR
jgi:hypothetical protein